MNRRPNILLITADQWRGDCLGTCGHPIVRTPNLDRFAETATVFERHYAATAPCSPARASLYTGLYQMNHRVVWNGAPLDNRFDNIARAARRAGYAPTLFGYTDTSPDPRLLHPNDPALQTYEGILPGFVVRQDLSEDDKSWLTWLAGRGHDPETFDTIHQAKQENGERISRQAPAYSKEETQTAFLADAFLGWLSEQPTHRPWMAHISFLRPHPPIIVPPPYNTLYNEQDDLDFIGADTAKEEAAFHPLNAALQDYQHLSSHIPGSKAHVRDLSHRDLKRIRALYFGMISEVDAQLGRILDALDREGSADRTLIIFTSDHADMMGDHWMLGKGGFYEQSYHIPLLIRLPGGAKANRVSHFTSATDIFPTLTDLLDLQTANTLDGVSLLPFLHGQSPAVWRDSVIFEYDYRILAEKLPLTTQPDGGEGHALLSMVGHDWHYVHCLDLPPLMLKRGDTHLRNYAEHPDMHNVVSDLRASLLSLRMRQNDETLARKMVWDYHG